MQKSFKLESKDARGEIEWGCKRIVESDCTNIDTCVCDLTRSLPKWVQDSVYIGRGGSHIYISDVWKVRMAIIYFQD